MVVGTLAIAKTLFVLTLVAFVAAIRSNQDAMNQHVSSSHRVLPISGVILNGPTTLPNNGIHYTYTINVTGTLNGIRTLNFDWEVSVLSWWFHTLDYGFSQAATGNAGAPTEVIIEFELWCIGNVIYGKVRDAETNTALIVAVVDEGIFARSVKSNVLNVTCVPAPSSSPSASPSAHPTQSPTKPITVRPSASPSAKPSAAPSPKPSAAPSPKPSAAPSGKPSVSPSPKPSVAPSAKPSAAPTPKASAGPSASPTASPTPPPTPLPTTLPTNPSTPKPSFIKPTKKPIYWQPTLKPTRKLCPPPSDTTVYTSYEVGCKPKCLYSGGTPFVIPKCGCGCYY